MAPQTIFMVYIVLAGANMSSSGSKFMAHVYHVVTLPIGAVFFAGNQEVSRASWLPKYKIHRQELHIVFSYWCVLYCYLISILYFTLM